MPYILEDLVINRVDLVDEGANSAAFITLLKRKEQSKMELEEILSKLKPEHAEVVQAAIGKAKEELQKAQEELATVTAERDAATQECAKACGERDKACEERDAANEGKAAAESELETLKQSGQSEAAFDETETLKSMPENVKVIFEKMKTQKDAAEEELRKAKDAERTAEAIAKASQLKAIPVEQEKLVGIIKSADADLLDLLTVVNAAIEGTVLGEIGKSTQGTGHADAWAKIEAKADEIAKRDNITKQKAVSVVIKENPDLYKEYLQGGAN